jgi:hypothetical protein
LFSSKFTDIVDIINQLIGDDVFNTEIAF